jgi:hypothetical protein
MSMLSDHAARRVTFACRSNPIAASVIRLAKTTSRTPAGKTTEVGVESDTLIRDSLVEEI